MNELSRSLMTKIDEYVKEHSLGTEQENTVAIAYTQIEKLAAENNLNPEDLLVDYLDHVALVSKKIGGNQGEKLFTEEDITSESFKLY